MLNLKKRARAVTDGAAKPDEPGTPSASTAAGKPRLFHRSERLASDGFRPHANLLSATTGTWAWFHLTGLDWDGLAPRDHNRMVKDQAHRWADMVGHRVVLRGVANPFPVDGFGDAMRVEYPTPANKDAAASEIVQAQKFAAALGARRPLVVAGVRLSGKPVQTADLPAVLGDEPAVGFVEEVRRTYADILTIMRRPGWKGEPLTAAALAWLFETSIAPGVPVHYLDTASLDDPKVLLEGARAVSDPYQLSMPLHAVRDGRAYEKHVATLRLKDTPPDVDTDRLMVPWLAWPGTVEFPVDWVATCDVYAGEQVKSSAALRRRINVNIAEHNRDHGYEAPAEVQRGIDRSREIVDEVSNGTREVATRVQMQVTYTVTCDTKKGVLDKASALIVEAQREHKTTLVHEWGQYADYRRLIPGEPCVHDGHVTTAPATFVAAGVPNVTSAAGDSVGVMFGGMAGWPGVYVFDPFGGLKRNRPNVYVAVGEPGCGKTTLLSKVAEHLTVHGVPGVAFDPSGMMAPLGETANIKGSFRQVSLTTADAGILQPHFLVPEPKRRDYIGQDEWERAVRAADGERADLAIDAVMASLPWSMVSADHDGSILATVEAASARVGGAYGTHSRELIDAVRRESSYGARVADALEARAELPDGRLIFPRRDLDPSVIDALTSSAPFTLVTMPGLTLPPKGVDDRSKWTREQHRSVPILMLGSRFASVPIWRNRDRKWFVSDELGIATGGQSSFSAFLLRLLYDSRKFNASAGLALQTYNTLAKLDDNVTSLIGASFLGRTDRGNAAASLPALGLTPGNGWEDTAPSLSDGEFIVSGWDNRVRDIQVDQAWWHPDMVEAVYTTPQVRADGAATPFGAW